MEKTVSIAGVDEQILMGENSFELVKKPISMRDASSQLAGLLEECVKKRVDGASAIAFSGGLDSCLLAKLVGEEIPLLTVGITGSYDLANAKRSASVLGRRVGAIEISGSDVAAAKKDVQEIIGTSDMLQTGIAIPFYFLEKIMKERGFKSLIAGQGADELFAGYKRYEESLALESDLLDDLVNIYENNLRRDLAVAEHFGIGLRLPFLDREVIQFALNLPTELKLNNSQRKLVLREVGKNVGLSPLIYNQPKKAIQYGTGVAAILKAIPRC